MVNDTHKSIIMTLANGDVVDT